MVNENDFGWELLLKRIKRKNVIPVIGQGLYCIESQKNKNKHLFLYDFLAEKVANSCGATLEKQEKHKFAKACFQFLKKNNNDYPELSDFLKETMAGTHLIHGNPLKKLARIKWFNIFITTAYDDFLANCVKTVRSVPTETLYYTPIEKCLHLLDNNLFNALNNFSCTLVYHIFGHLEKVAPAYTERDILESILEFKKDMEANPQNNLFQKLQSSSLLFMGCGYDDWLFRFFIRSVATKPYEIFGSSQTREFVGENFSNNKKDPFQELPRFLKDHQVEVFYSGAGMDVVDLLLEKLENDSPENILQPCDFPGHVFISFEGTDRNAAGRLAAHLRKNNIDVWLDESKFKGGDKVDDTIIKAINKCPVFVPLISRHSQKIHTDDGKLKYHCQEWEWAHARSKDEDKKVTIIPVIIDDTDWVYENFKGLYCVKVPGGERSGDYEKLMEQLKELLKRFR